MNKYELAVVLKPDLDEETQSAEFEAIFSLIARFDGSVEKTDNWGKRRLAYEIKKINEGFYSFITFSADGDVVKEIEQRLNIMENVLRHLVIRMEG